MKKHLNLGIYEQLRRYREKREAGTERGTEAEHNI